VGTRERHGPRPLPRPARSHSNGGARIPRADLGAGALGSVGAVKTLTVRAHRRPSITTACLAGRHRVYEPLMSDRCPQCNRGLAAEPAAVAGA